MTWLCRTTLVLIICDEERVYQFAALLCGYVRASSYLAGKYDRL